MGVKDLLRNEASTLNTEVPLDALDLLLECDETPLDTTRPKRLVVEEVSSDGEIEVVKARAEGFKYSFRVRLLSFLTKTAPEVVLTTAVLSADHLHVLRVFALLRLFGHAIETVSALAEPIELTKGDAVLLLRIWHAQQQSDSNMFTAEQAERLLAPDDEGTIRKLLWLGCVIKDPQGNIRITDSLIIERAV